MPVNCKLVLNDLMSLIRKKLNLQKSGISIGYHFFKIIDCILYEINAKTNFIATRDDLAYQEGCHK